MKIDENVINSLNDADEAVAAMISMFIVMFSDVTDRRLIQDERPVNIATEYDVESFSAPAQQTALHAEYRLETTDYMRTLTMFFQIGFDTSKGTGDMILIAQKFNAFKNWCGGFWKIYKKSIHSTADVLIFSTEPHLPNDDWDNQTGCPFDYEITYKNGKCEKIKIDDLLKYSKIFFGKKSTKNTYRKILNRINNGEIPAKTIDELVFFDVHYHCVVRLDPNDIISNPEISVVLTAYNVIERNLRGERDKINGNTLENRKIIADIIKSKTCDVYMYDTYKKYGNPPKRTYLYCAQAISHDVVLINDDEFFVTCEIIMPNGSLNKMKNFIKDNSEFYEEDKNDTTK